ncbi:MAG: NAD+ synthase [Bacteroidetes bacterium]|nr:NAD+ synthase [Bacteroidota bacterium]
MKIVLAQLNFSIGDFEKNSFKIREAIRHAKKEKADLVVFSELAICGYPPLDFLEFDDFVERCKKEIAGLAKECIGIAAIVGGPSVNPGLEGKNLFNSAYFLEGGKIRNEIHKSLLPNYDVFDEYRYFEPGKNSECIELNGVKIALTICEDLWNVEDDPMYVNCPMDELTKEKPQIMINIAASPFDHTHAEKRKAILKRNALQYKIPVVYVNHVGAQTELIFDGGSLVLNDAGDVVHELKYFEEDVLSFEFPENRGSVTGETKGKQPVSKIQSIHDALTLGIRDYFQKQNFTKAILGLSGGIDSAVVLALAVETLGEKNVHAVLMPSPFSSRESVDDSLALSKNLGNSCDIIPIEPLYNEYLSSLKSQFGNLPFNVAEENIQARIRGNILMALSNKSGYIVLNTSNKSELAVGYGTLYGDMAGGLSVIGDVYKTEVYELAHYINRHKKIIPETIIAKAPSAELRPGQKDSDSLPDYNILDSLLFQYIEQRKGPAELMASEFDAALVNRVLKLVNTNEYKRSQAPPILRVSPKAFGLGRRMPIVGKYLS